MLQSPLCQYCLWKQIAPVPALVCLTQPHRIAEVQMLCPDLYSAVQAHSLQMDCRCWYQAFAAVRIQTLPAQPHPQSYHLLHFLVLQTTDRQKYPVIVQNPPKSSDSIQPSAGVSSDGIPKSHVNHFRNSHPQHQLECRYPPHPAMLS